MTLPLLLKFLDHYKNADIWHAPDWIQGRINGFRLSHDAYSVERMSSAFYPTVHLGQWMKVPSTLHTVQQAFEAWGYANPLSSRVVHCLEWAPAVLFFVPRGHYGKHWAIRHFAFLRDHWSRIGYLIEGISALALLKAGRTIFGTAILLSTIAQAILSEIPPAPHRSLSRKVVGLVGLANKIGKSSIVPALLGFKENRQEALLSTVILFYFIYQFAKNIAPPETIDSVDRTETES